MFHRRFYYDYNCSLSFTNEDELVHVKMLADKLFEELKLNELNYLVSYKSCKDLDEWFEVTEPRTGRVFDINVCELYRGNETEASGMKCSKVGLAVYMYECFEDEQGLWSTDISKHLSFKLELQSQLLPTTIDKLKE